MNILQINSSARADGSHSTRLADAIVERLRAAPTPRRRRSTVRDLGRTPHPELNEAALQALFTPAEQRTPEQAARVALDDALIAELQAADVVVLGVPMYNFGVPRAEELDRRDLARQGHVPATPTKAPRAAEGQEGLRRADARRPVPQHAGRHAGAVSEDGARVPRHDRRAVRLRRRPGDGRASRAAGARLGADADRRGRHDLKTRRTARSGGTRAGPRCRAAAPTGRRAATGRRGARRSG